MVETITRQVVRMAALASGREPQLQESDAFTLRAEGSGAYQVTLHLANGTLFRSRLILAPGVWEPQTYAGLAGDVLAALSLRGQARPPVPEGPFLTQLTMPTAELLAGENERISSWLTRQPLEPAAHEQAAMLLGTLGLRENAGRFSDVRPVENRLTAHLALAQALRAGQPASRAGKVAAMLGELLAGAEQPCEEKLKALCASAVEVPELRPWIVAAKFRNRQDWRLADGRLPGSLLERTEFFRALCAAAGPEAGCTALTRRPFEDVSDWPRILLGEPYTANEGRRFIPFALPFELEEIRAVFPQLASVPAQAPAFAAVLNRLSGGAVVGSAREGFAMRVLDDGLWAQYLQRHLCHALCETERYQRLIRGQRDEALAFTRAATAIFGNLRLFPQAAVMSGEAEWAASGRAGLERLRREHPEEITAAVTRVARRDGAPGEEPGDWFSPALPAGTAYDFAARAELQSAPPGAGKEGLEALHRLAPWNFAIAERLLAEAPARASTRRYQEVLGPLVKYHRAAWQKFPELVRDNPEVYIASLTQMADLDPELYGTLGEYLARHQRPETAAGAYAALLGRRVTLATRTAGASWLAHYYLERHRPEEALAAAQLAEGSGLSSGLQALAQLREELGDLPAAEALYQRVEDVHEDPVPLLHFYERNRARQPAYEAELAATMTRLFPAGVVPEPGETSPQPPVSGVSVRRGGAPMEAAGLRAADVVVSVNGRHASSLAQYAYLSGVSETARLALVVYRAGVYRALRVEGAALPLSELATWHR